MAAVDKENSRISFSTQEPSLRDCIPSSLHRAGSIRSQFESIKFEDKPSRENTGDGSRMVKREKLFPELKPNNSYGIKKLFFDQAWLREQRQAQLEHFSVQRQSAPQQNRQPEPVLERLKIGLYQRI